MRKKWMLLGALALGGCGLDPIVGTWRSADQTYPSVVLELDEPGGGFLMLDDFVYVATVRHVGGVRYVIEQCSVSPELHPSCEEHVCEFDNPDNPLPDPWDDDPFDTWEPGPDYTVLLCEFRGEGRWLYLD